MQVQTPETRETDEPLVCGGLKADGDRAKRKSIFPPHFSPLPGFSTDSPRESHSVPVSLEGTGAADGPPPSAGLFCSRRDVLCRGGGATGA